MLGPNATYLEVAWTSIAVLGAAFAMALLAHIWLSYQAVETWIRQGRAVRWGPRHRFALGFMVGVGLLLVVWTGFILLGANALTNAPPTTPDRIDASERGGTILVVVEGVLLAFQVILLAAWIAVGKPTLHPGSSPQSPVSLMFKAIDLGRQMGHAVANEAQAPVSVLDEIVNDPSTPEDMRLRAAEALASLELMVMHVQELHRTVKAMERVS